VGAASSRAFILCKLLVRGWKPRPQFSRRAHTFNAVPADISLRFMEQDASGKLFDLTGTGACQILLRIPTGSEQ